MSQEDYRLFIQDMEANYGLPLFNDHLNYNYYTVNPMQGSLYERNPIRRVISEEAKARLLPILFNEIDDKEKNSHCSITFESFDKEDQVIQLPCKHCFLVEPIMKWLTEESCECPVCRYVLDSQEKRVEEANAIEANAIEANAIEANAIEDAFSNIFLQQFLSRNFSSNNFLSNNFLSNNFLSIPYSETDILTSYIMQENMDNINHFFQQQEQEQEEEEES